MIVHSSNFLTGNMNGHCPFFLFWYAIQYNKYVITENHCVSKGPKVSSVFMKKKLDQKPFHHEELFVLKTNRQIIAIFYEDNDLDCSTYEDPHIL